MCVCMYVHTCTTEPCGPSATWPSHVFRDPGPNTEAILYHWQKKREGGREKGRKDKSSPKKDKGNWPMGPKVSSCLYLGWKEGRGKKKKGNLEFTRGKFSFFSWTAECLIMGLDLTSAPLGMWNRGLVVMGGRVWGGWCGSGAEV